MRSDHRQGRAPDAPRGRRGPELPADLSRLHVIGLAGAVALAAANFLFELGSSSLFVDEVYSWNDATVPLGDLVDRLRDNEVTPLGYFALLHEWIGRLGAESDWAMRLPSAAAAILLVPVLCDVGNRIGGAAAGVTAAYLGALSPLVLDYAQQVRAYAPAMLLCAVAAAAALRASEERERAGRWAVAAGAAAAAAFAMHYTTALVTLPLLAWVATRRSIRPRARAAAIALPALTALAVLPLMLDQLASGRQDAISPFARLTLEHALAVLGTPWDSRLDEPLDLLRWLGAATVVAAVGWLLARGRPPQRVIALCAAVPVAAAFVTTLASDDALITRYTAVSAPFALLAVAVAAWRIPPLPRAGALAVVAIVAVAGTIRGHDPNARFADARAVVDRIEQDWRPGEPIVTPARDVTVDVPVRYYVHTNLPGASVLSGERRRDIRSTVAESSVVWAVSRKGHDVAGGLRRLGFRATVIDRLGGTIPLELTRGAR